MAMDAKGAVIAIDHGCEQAGHAARSTGEGHRIPFFRLRKAVKGVLVAGGYLHHQPTSRFRPRHPALRLATNTPNVRLTSIRYRAIVTACP